MDRKEPQLPLVADHSLKRLMVEPRDPLAGRMTFSGIPASVDESDSRHAIV
jgi:hypothetical protein